MSLAAAKPPRRSFFALARRPQARRGEARRHKEEAAARLEEYRAASAANSPTKTKSFTDERTEWDQRLAKLGY